MKRKIYLLLDNVRSAQNVGALLRTAEGLGVTKVLLCGITPYPLLKSGDERPPYLAAKINRRIAKTALGAEQTQPFIYLKDSIAAANKLKSSQVKLIALEQHHGSISLPDFKLKTKEESIALILGNEIDGISPALLAICDTIVEIPMSGTKESFNVSAAGAMALFYMTLML